jgi:hypothetical protein
VCEREGEMWKEGWSLAQSRQCGKKELEGIEQLLSSERAIEYAYQQHQSAHTVHLHRCCSCFATEFGKSHCTQHL